jgi:hypothetical protein
VNRILQSALSRIQEIRSIIVGRKLHPQSLEEALDRKLPSGATKSNVIEFVRSMRPIQCNDYGKEVIARWVEETGDLVRSWDIVVVFKFDEEERLTHYCQTERDFIDYDLTAMNRRF